MIGNKFYPKKPQEFICEKCDFLSFNKKDFSRHLKTKKHLSNNLGQVSNDFTQKTQLECSCGKCYKNHSGLWRHKKKCPTKINDTQTNLIMTLIKENSELKHMMMKVIENGTNNININTTTNKTFNLNIYLNETCKNAMNISDFVNSINLNLDDLENIGEKGYIEGISNIFLKNLTTLEHHMRPIHCSDFKREILYIKDNNIWEKETNDKPILTKAIKNVANKNIKQIQYWRDKNPDCTKSDSKKNDIYLKIVSNSMNGLTKEDEIKNINKIISNVVKEVVIDKY